MIEGVYAKELVTHADERGFFRELIRVSDDFFAEGFGQWSHSLMYANAVKAWHVHELQVDWWYVPIGVLKLALHDLRETSPTKSETAEFLLGENQPATIVRIPPGVAHGCKTISAPVHLFYVTSRVYNPDDEGRIAHSDPEIAYDWLAGPVIT